MHRFQNRIPHLGIRLEVCLIQVVSFLDRLVGATSVIRHKSIESGFVGSSEIGIGRAQEGYGFLAIT